MRSFVRDSKPGPMTKWTEKKCIEEVTKLYNRFKNSEDMVYYKEAVIEEEYCRDDVMVWCNNNRESQELLRLLKKFSDIHETRLAKRGLTKKHSEWITKMVLSNHHDWKDKREQEVYGKDGEPLNKAISVEIVTNEDKKHSSVSEEPKQ